MTTESFLDCEILGLHNDSRQIKPGFLFIAYPGVLADGRLFISEAIKAGAIAIVFEPENWPTACHLPADFSAVAIPGLASKLAEIASRFYDEPTKQLKLTGITGTNGKTTIAYQLAQAHNLLGQRSAYIGTIGEGDVNALQPLLNTTPDALCLQQFMHKYQQQQLKQICMEVSSHALDQGRVRMLEFQQAIFTNLSHDHLDYHQTMEVYAEAKAKLFACPSLKWAIINNDDTYSLSMKKRVPASCEIISYGIKNKADVQALNWNINLDGTSLNLNSPWGEYQLTFEALGFFNIYNTLAIFASLLASGYSAKDVVPVIAKLKAAPGRMEIVAKEPYVIVDYAHSPDALENVLATLQDVKKNRILLVFGCGGDRDKGKRPMMGKIASQYADIVILTNDNPRTEDPLTIIEEIAAGIDTKTNYFKIPDREAAIAKAISLAEKDDLILIAGKGHESYQQIGNVRYDFSDQLVATKLVIQILNQPEKATF